MALNGCIHVRERLDLILPKRAIRTGILSSYWLAGLYSLMLKSRKNLGLVAV